MAKLGTKIGAMRFATIENFNSDGTVRIALDEGAGAGALSQFNAPIPAAWTGPNGEFIGGYPAKGAAVVAAQGAGGQWFVVSFINNNDVFDQPFVTSGNTLMGALRPGRALIQTKNGNRIFADPDIGMQLGNAREFVHVDPSLGIFSHNIDAEMSFTEAHRKINQIVKRDVSDNISRNSLGSTLDSQSYDRQLRPICLDPTANASPSTVGFLVRNPPLIENREIVYEFAHSFRFTTDEDEASRYVDPSSAQAQPKVSRRNMRSDAFSLSLEYPNHLIETVKGTAVDAFGNILDINRNPIPIGKEDNISIRKASDKQEAFAKIRALERKSIAYHWELNARKGDSKQDDEDLPDITAVSPPAPDDVSNYGRNRSRFFIDIDKEGQFKINIPASSETGNVPLLTRYENYSVVLARSGTSEGDEVHPNQFIRNDEKREIFANDFAVSSSIELKSAEEDSKANVTPNDWIVEDNPSIKFGTAHHDITQTAKDFTVNANWLNARDTLVVDSIHPLNNTVGQFEKIVTNTIMVDGPGANAGGRSGVINFDGFVAMNFGANTVDRQSLWIDTAGGAVTRFGRDLQNISLASTFDGDVLMEIGAETVPSTADSRFGSQNNAFRGGTLDIRIMTDSGIASIIRVDPTGMHFVTPGRMTFWAEQDIIMKSVRGDLKFEGENITMYSETTKRKINRHPDQETIG